MTRYVCHNQSIISGKSLTAFPVERQTRAAGAAWPGSVGGGLLVCHLPCNLRYVKLEPPHIELALVGQAEFKLPCISGSLRPKFDHEAVRADITQLRICILPKPLLSGLLRNISLGFVSYPPTPRLRLILTPSTHCAERYRNELCGHKR